MSPFRQASHLDHICKALSPERLQPFRVRAEDGAPEAVARYAWNVALSEAFYPLLHTLEVIFRSGLHDTIAAHVPVRTYDLVPTWLDARPSLLEPRGQA